MAEFDTNGHGSTQNGERTFTQEDVNRIVQERLARVKTEPSEKEIELNNREAELNKRELRLKAREVFAEKKLPADLLDILDYSDEKKLEDNIGILEKTYSMSIGMTETSTGVEYRPMNGQTPAPRDPVREAMGPR